MMVGCLQGSDARTEDFGHLFIFHFLKIFHVENHLLLLGQLVDGMDEFLLDVVAIEVWVAFQFVQDIRIDAVKGNRFAGPFLVGKGQAFVECYAE
jgi:hypothetical protein